MIAIRNSDQRSPQQIVFCDFDGPIVDVSPRYYATYQQGLQATYSYFQAQGTIIPIHPLSKPQFWQMKQDRVQDQEIALRSGLQGQQIDYFLTQVVQIVNHPDLLLKDKIQSGVNWALALLHSQGVKLVLVTLRPQDQAQQILQNYGLARLFSGIYGTSDWASPSAKGDSASARAGLRDAAYFNYAEVKTKLLKQAIAEQSSPDFPLTSAWVIGDTEADILAGQAFNIPTIALTCGIRSCQKLKQFHPDSIQENLLDAARYLLKVHQQLVNA
jgi:phosphoglycolate phosphatase-like HAD superfamily hydrolase